MITPRSFLYIAAALTLTSCANSTLQRTIHTSQCVLADDRLGKAVLAPAEAREYLRGVAAEAKAILGNMPEKLANGGDLSSEYALIEDLLDLVTRLEACIREGGGVTASQKDHIESQLAAIRPGLVIRL